MKDEGWLDEHACTLAQCAYALGYWWPQRRDLWSSTCVLEIISLPRRVWGWNGELVRLRARKFSRQEGVFSLVCERV